MMQPKIILVGNLDSLLFRQRVEVLEELLGSSALLIFNTKREHFLGILRLLLASFCLIVKVVMCQHPVRLLLHGAYSPILWPLLFLRRVHTVSIIQGSELNIDFTGIKAHIIKSILTHSALVVCRSEVQAEQAIRLTGVSSKNCLTVRWGLKQELFDIPIRNSFAIPVLISPRATQSEYNIPIIFNVIKRLKNEGYRLRFVYVRFNPKFELNDLEVADEILDSPSQQALWEKMAAADFCISVPDYDGLSNTVMEALALGSLPVVTSLLPYDFLKQDARLGFTVEFGASFSQNSEQLYMTIKKALGDVEVIRGGIEFRRKFASDYLKASKGIDSIVEVLSDC
jgi:hypothetical protein